MVPARRSATGPMKTHRGRSQSCVSQLFRGPSPPPSLTTEYSVHHRLAQSAVPARTGPGLPPSAPPGPARRQQVAVLEFSGVQVAVSQCLPPLFSEGLQPANKRTRTTRSRASTNKSTRRIYKVQARRCVFRSTSRLIYASRADVLSPPVRVRDHTVVLRTSDLRISRYLLRL